jgi:hypothetical protein
MTAGRRAELEAILRATPDDFDTVAVYADALMTDGDPLGEQIAIELSDPGRRPLLARWVAAHVTPGSDDLLVTGQRSTELLHSPAGDFCRGVAAALRPLHADRLFEALALRLRPFVTRIQLVARFGAIALDARHVAALPNLAVLDLDGDVDLRGFRHPGVKRLVRRSRDLSGLGSWSWPLDLPGCERLVVDVTPWSTIDPASVTFEQLPALAMLDVSRCEPRHLAGKPDRTNLDVVRWVLGLPCLPRLRALRLPSVRTEASARQLRWLIARAPDTAIEIARSYARCAAGGELASTRVRFAPPWPWPPDDQLPDRPVYRLTGPGEVDLELRAAAITAALERVFDRRDEQFRDDWRRIWRALDTCSVRAPARLPFEIVARAFAGFTAPDAAAVGPLCDAILALRGEIEPGQPVELAPKL